MSSHPGGKPINAVTHSGFSGPGCAARTTSGSGRALRSIVSADALPDFQSRAVGVGQADADATAPFSVGLPRANFELPLPESAAMGVGHRAAVLSGVPPCANFVLRPPVSFARGVGHGDRTAVARPSPLVGDAPARLWLPQTVGVGHTEDALSQVRSANVGCAKSRPDRTVPERGQAPEYNVSPPNKESCDVLHDDVAGSKLANESQVLEPETAARTREASARASKRQVLAGLGNPPQSTSTAGSSMGTSFLSMGLL